jgi:hypothetical protein
MIRPLESGGQLNFGALTNHVDDSPAHSARSTGNNGFHHDDASRKQKP